MRLICTYPARLEADEEGRLVVHFPDLPEALTDGADEAEALTEASDCLSAALASRIVDQEQIPVPSQAGPNMHLVSPEPIIALKAALYGALRVAGKLEAALSALGYTIGIEVRDRRVA